jgi:SAM-dependent methyltransferase
MTVFDHYAAYYDLFYGSKDYRSESQYVVRHLRKFAPRAASVLELGCGTAAHAAELVREGYGVTGLDMSEGMLKSARQRRDALAEEQRGRLELLHGDARRVRLGRDFDAVMALFHVMSYQSSNDDLLATLTTAAQHLSSGGIFLFDFWYGPAVLSQRPETRARDLENDSIHVTRIARPRLRENANLVDVNFTVLVQDKTTDSIRRLEETHVMRYLFLPEIDYLLATAGMQRLCAKEWMSDDEPSVASWSGFVVARKIVRGS